MQRAHAGLAFAGERMLAVHDERERFDQQRLCFDIRRLHILERDADIGFVVDEQRLDAFLRHLAHRQRHVRIAAVKRLDERPDEIARESRRDRDPQRAAAQVLHVVNRAPAFREIVQRLPRIAEIHVAGVGQPRHAPGAVEQLRAERLLELADLLGQRGLRHVQCGGRAREAAVLGDGEEVVDMAQQHGGSYKSCLSGRS